LANDRSSTWFGSAFARVVLLAGFYAVAGKLGLALSLGNDRVSVFWPPTGIAVAGLVLWGLRCWPGVFLGALAVNLLDGSPFATAAGIGVGNTVAPVAAVYLLRYLDFRPSLSRLRDTVSLAVGGGLIAMTISATCGTAVLYAAGSVTNVAETWRTWWVGDAMGVILFAPLILTVCAGSLRSSRIVSRWKSAVLLLGLFAVVTYVAVTTESSPLGYAVIPLALWIAVQLEQEGAAAAIVIMTVLDTWGVVTSPESGISVEFQLLRLQGVNATIALIVLSFAAVMSERRRARDELEAATEELEVRVRSRTAELEQSEQRLAQAQRLASIGSFQWDAAADTNEWSDELFRIYGLPTDGEPPGLERYISFIRPDVRDSTRTSIEAAIRAGRSMNHEYPVVLDNGTEKWVHAYIEVICDAHGNLTGLRGTCQDITERKTAELGLRASELRFKTLLDSAPDAVVVADAHGTIVVTNAQTSKLLGYSSAELIGRQVELLLPFELRAEHRNHRETYTASPSARPMGAGSELSARHKDGSLVPVDISLAPVDTGSATLVIALLRDASERRRSEDALRLALQREQAATEDLRRLDEAKTTFLSAVSHELRTPLTAILGFAELLQDEDFRRSEELAVDLVDRLQYSATRLAELLGDLLDLDRLERGILEPLRRPCVLRDMVERALGTVHTHNHPLTVEVDDEIVCVDPAQTERIIENLVTNAVKYTPRGASIVVQARALEDGGVDIVVTDEGPGIPEDMLEMIFKPFARGDVGSFTPGTGIGLALVDRFAQLHGGRAWASNRDGGGATFRVHLPGPATPAEAVA
jgi:PAS domain S-box-containing protein